MHKSDDPNTSTIAVIGIVGAILIFVVIVLLQAVFYRVEHAETAKKTFGGAPEELTRLRAEQEEELNSYRWVNEQEGVVSIPIKRAMEIVVRETPAEGESVSQERGK